uniref:Uncharacterized protein n=1 Tax=Anguilla anguilla TaxID=7936 RepID=A0A0E9U1T0_ANGAN
MNEHKVHTENGFFKHKVIFQVFPFMLVCMGPDSRVRQTSQLVLHVFSWEPKSIEFLA